MSTDKVNVTLANGELQGRSVRTPAGSALAFSAVPYATALRFELPQPVEPWTGRRDATQSGPASPQPIAEVELVPDMAVATTSEDCLSAEVWTPGLDGRRPVLVWIPGGRFQIGGASLATYDGALLATEGDLVVVGLNYRLGALGFLVADGVPANLGLHDLLAALRWLRDEVEAFGGDPDRITLMGESAGAGAISHLLAIPEVETLIAGAIIQSAAPASTLDPVAAKTVTAGILDAAGLDSVEALRTLPVDALIAAQEVAVAAALATVGMMPLHPIVDGELLTAAPMDAARAGTLASVPLIIGSTDDEMELFREMMPDLPVEFAVAFLAEKLEGVLGYRPSDEQVRRGYEAAGSDLVEAVADTELHLPAALIADAQAARGVPVFRYRFGWKAPGLGAAHALDLPFTFGTLDVDRWREFAGARDEAADALSASMRSAWASFCHGQVPACEPIGAWPTHTAGERRITHLDRVVTVVADFDTTRVAAWTGAAL